MKNDILLFAVMFAVAWIGFGALKGHLELPTTENATPAANNIESANLTADSETDGASKPAGTQSVKQVKATPEDGPNLKTTEETSGTDGEIKKDSEAEKSAESDTSQTPEQAIEQVLKNQTEAWNRGDLDGFMDAYWNDENLTFSGGDGTLVGFEDTYANYRDRYPEGKMGQIKFEDLKTEMVGKESAIVTGRFYHQLPEEEVQGNFSLVLKTFDGQWKIIHDHTSVAK